MPHFYPSGASGTIVRLFLLSFLFAFTSSLQLLAQLIERPVFQCATESISPADRQELEAEAAFAYQLKKASKAFVSITYVPVRPHIIRRSNGTGGYSLASMNNVLALTNKYYLQNGNGIQFYFAGTTPDYIDSDVLYAQYRQIIDDATVAPRDASNALNQYYVHKFDNPNLGGYAKFPSDDVASTRTIILDENHDDDMGNRLVPHELGHSFNLLHTFEPAYGYERVTRDAGANCSSAGDLVCDTPADPYGRFSGANGNCITGCPPSYTCTFTDSQGAIYTPSPTNLMSYYFPCTHDFTAGQYDRIQAGLALRQSHTAYTLDAPETAMTAPSNVIAAVSGSSVLITWQDNASNEMGYFVERSTSPIAGFVPIGGVAPDVTSFTDRSFMSRTQYYYRVKASNTTTGSISSTAAVFTPDCRPSFANDGCSFSININSVTVNNVPLSQNSGCSPASVGYYTSFTAVSSTVTAGHSATFTVDKSTANLMGVTIWVDLNNNGTFDANEKMYQMSATDKESTLSGTLTIPATTTANAVTMRVVAIYSGVPGDPCGNYGYGETEDYQLIVRPPCLPAVASLSGSSTIIAGQVATITTSLTGTAPFSLTVNSTTGSSITFSEISQLPFSFTVSPTVSTTYSIGQVTNGCGVGSSSGAADVSVTGCSTMYSLKVGAWDDPTVWSCNRVPNQNDEIQISHEISIPANFVARALRVLYNTGGRLTISPYAHLRLAP